MGGEEGHDKLLEEPGRVLQEGGLQGLAQQLKIPLILKQPVEDEERFDTAVVAAFGAAWAGAWEGIGRHGLSILNKPPSRLVKTISEHLFQIKGVISPQNHLSVFHLNVLHGTSHQVSIFTSTSIKTTDRKGMAMTDVSILKLSTVVFAIALCTGCTTQAPNAASGNTPGRTVVNSQNYTASYDKVWGVILAVLQEEEMTLSVVDKSSGMVSGIKNVLPSTADMFMGYSVRTLISVTATQGASDVVKVTLKGSMERKYKKADWRPDHVTDTSEYVNSLYDKIAARLLD